MGGVSWWLLTSVNLSPGFLSFCLSSPSCLKVLPAWYASQWQEKQEEGPHQEGQEEVAPRKDRKRVSSPPRKNRKRAPTSVSEEACSLRVHSHFPYSIYPPASWQHLPPSLIDSKWSAHSFYIFVPAKVSWHRVGRWWNNVICVLFDLETFKGQETGLATDPASCWQSWLIVLFHFDLPSPSLSFLNYLPPPCPSLCPPHVLSSSYCMKKLLGNL